MFFSQPCSTFLTLLPGHLVALLHSTWTLLLCHILQSRKLRVLQIFVHKCLAVILEVLVLEYRNLKKNILVCKRCQIIVNHCNNFHKKYQILYNQRKFLVLFLTFPFFIITHSLHDRTFVLMDSTNVQNNDFSGYISCNPESLSPQKSKPNWYYCASWGLKNKLYKYSIKLRVLQCNIDTKTK